MWFRTDDECRKWIAGGFSQNERGAVVAKAMEPTAREVVPFRKNREALLYSARVLADAILSPWGGDMETLLWVADTTVGASNTDWNVYYRMRRSFGDLRQLHEAPGHVFLDYERGDLVSFMYLGILSGWDFYVVGQANDLSVDVSHDGFFDIYGPPDRASELARQLQPGGTGAV